MLNEITSVLSMCVERYKNFSFFGIDGIGHFLGQQCCR